MVTKTGFPAGVQLGSSADFGIGSVGGLPAMAILRVAANVAGGETVTINSDVYRVAIVNTDTTKNVGNGELNNTNPFSTLTIVAHGLVGGDLVRVENEIMAVVQVLNANQVSLKRGVSNTTIAAHADGTDIYTEATPGGAGIAVGLVTTLTPAVFTDALVADINNRGNEKVKAIGEDDNTVVVLTAKTRGGDIAASSATLTLAETLAGSGNAWDATSVANGRPWQHYVIMKIVPTAAEVTKGLILRYFPFTPVVEAIYIYATADGTFLAWDGTATVSGNKLTITNAGSVDWDADDTILLFVRGA